MPLNQYHFFTHWRFRGTENEVYDILADAPDLPRWWPSVYLQVEQLVGGDERGVGRHVRLLTQGWLPYRIKWEFICTEAKRPSGFSLQASGDFRGRGIWRLSQDGEFVDVTFDWKVRAEKPLLRYLSAFLRPVFAANHRWAMKQGEESLRLELQRRQRQHQTSRKPQ